MPQPPIDGTLVRFFGRTGDAILGGLPSGLLFGYDCVAGDHQVGEHGVGELANR
jgi:hypothetical protein